MKYRMELVINLDEIQQAIYTEGTWHPAANATAWGVNSSNEPIVDRRVREGLDDLLYGDEDSIYGTAWRLHRARALLLLSRP